MSTRKPDYKSGHLNYSAGKVTNATPMTAATTNYQDETSFASGIPDLNTSPNKEHPNMIGKQNNLDISDSIPRNKSIETPYKPVYP